MKTQYILCALIIFVTNTSIGHITERSHPLYSKIMSVPMQSIDDIQTDNSRTVNSQTDNSRTDNSRTDNSQTDSSRTDNSLIYNSWTDNSQTDNSWTDNSRIDSSRTDNSRTDNSRTDISRTDNSWTYDSRTNNSQTDSSRTDNSQTDNSHNSPLVLSKDYSGIHEEFNNGEKGYHDLGAGDIISIGKLFDPENANGRILDDPAMMNMLLINWKFLQTKETEDDLQLPITDNILWYLITNVLGRYYLPSTNGTIVHNEQCVNDVNITLKPEGDWQKGNATILVDSWGKIPDGFLSGNTQVMGSLDECLHVKMIRDASGNGTSEGLFTGKYCAVFFEHEKSVSQKSQKRSGEFDVNMAPIIAGLPGSLLFGYGTCMPSTCNEEDLTNSLNHVIEGTNNSALIYCQSGDFPNLEVTAGFIVMIILLSIFGCLLLGSAVIDIWIHYTEKEHLREGPLKYLLVFSIYTNLEKIFKINTSVDKEVITSFYGIRVLSMTWIIWGHQYMIPLIVSGNKMDIAEIFNGHWLTQVILQAYPSVDTFFFMSGLLVAYGIIKEKEQSGSFNIIVFYIHRFFRLCVPILLLCGFLATMTRYFASGPLGPAIDDSPLSLQTQCQKYWWRDALFITNFYPSGEMAPLSCLAVTWYTAVDFQLFLVSPIILLPFIWGEKLCLYGNRKLNAGLIWLGIVTTISVLIPGIITGIHQFPPTALLDTSHMAQRLIDTKPWCRAQPYLIGMWLGILLRRDNRRKFWIQQWQVITGWLVAIVTGLAVVFGMYNYNQLGQNPGYNWAASIFYTSLRGLAWSLALAWVVFACLYGYGGLVNSFLSHPSWQPLSRLTYCIYLVAVPVQKILYTGNVVYPMYYSHLNKVLEATGALFVSGVCAVLLSLCTEAPVIGLEKLLLGRGKQKH